MYQKEKNPFTILFIGISAMLILIGLGVVLSAFRPSVTIIYSYDKNIDMNLHYLIEFPQRHFIHFTMEQGKTDKVMKIPAGSMCQDRHYAEITFSVDAAPGVGKSCNVTLTDGTNTMIVTISGTDTYEETTTNAFDLDVSAEALTFSYSQDGGGATEKGFCTVKYYYKENA